MASTTYILFLTALMATNSRADYSAFAGGSNFGLNTAQGFGSNGPFRMRMPSFPPLPWPSNFPFPNFPNFPQLNTIKPFTIQNIAAQGGQPGGQYNGVAIVSQTTSNKDGQSGGSTVVLNDNGKITAYQTGDSPVPISITQYKNAPFADFQQPEFKEFDFNDDVKKPNFDFPKFDSFSIKPFDMDRIKSYVPESNEKFTGNVYSYNSYSSDVNGVKKGGAILTTLNNNNGKVVEKIFDFNNGPH